MPVVDKWCFIAFYTVKDSIAKTYNVDIYIVKISVIYNSVSKSDFIQKKKKRITFSCWASWLHKIFIHS